MLFAAILAFVPAPSAEDDIVITGHSVPPFISPMGEPFRGRIGGRDAFVDWFGQADDNRDGILLLGEFHADAERFFARIDLNHDGQIDPDEIVQYEWEFAPEIQVNARLKRARAAPGEEPRKKRRPGAQREQAYDPDALQGAARYALLNIPQPVAAADADLNRAVSLDEFRNAATVRFRLLDVGRQGQLTLGVLEAMLPNLPPPGKRPRRRSKQPDARVGVPLPPGR